MTSHDHISRQNFEVQYLAKHTMPLRKSYRQGKWNVHNSCAYNLGIFNNFNQGGTVFLKTFVTFFTVIRTTKSYLPETSDNSALMKKLGLSL